MANPRALLPLVVLILALDLGSGTRLGRRRRGGGLLTPPRRPEGTELPEAQWFLQKLDHFNPTEGRTWKQQYFSNGSFYRPGGPVFLMIGGEGPANPVWLIEGSWIEYAKRLNAYLFQLEHRFYGKSHPTEDASVENLVYLSSEQALADLATFTVAMQEEHGLKENKWIAFGGSYPGSLAAWYRLKYPHLVHGSIATSAPVVAQINFKEYLEVVRDALATVNEKCDEAVKEATRQLNMLLLHRVGWQSITKRFKLCSPLDGQNKKDVANLFSILTENLEDVVQYNKDNRDFEGVKGTNITIDTLCEIMLDESKGPAITRYAAINSLALEVHEEECLDHTYESMIKELRATSWENNTNIGGRSWIYQTCTEFGFYQSSDSLNQPFGNEFPVNFFIQQCQDIYGEKFNLELLKEGVKRTNTLYGGKDLKVSRVVFPNGSIDMTLRRRPSRQSLCTMHGRLKIKTTAEQAAEKQKEREEKRKLYLGGLTKAFDKRSTGTYDEEGLKVTAQLLMANPDAATLWNFRREIILAMKSDDHESWDKLLQGELSVVENCLMKNHKSYGAWHHRCWVMENFPNPPWDKELALCDKYLKADERNFHCWDYRRFVVARSSKQPEDELKTSQQLIERNLSNYSAWHYRSKLLPLVYPPLPDTPHPVPENTLIKELQTVVEAVFTDPSDQSPWFFLRWLVNRQEKNPRLLQTGFISSGTKDSLLVCVFSKPLMQQNIPQISVDDEDVGNNEWHAPDNETYSYVWVVQLKELSEGEHSIAISFNSSTKKSLTVSPGKTSVAWMTELEEELTGLTRSTLEEVKQNCITLDELDPGNKWVLLTIVDVMWALDSYSHQAKISSYLSQLQDLDPLRTKYYADMKSKLSMETALKKHRLTTENDDQFKLNERRLTRIAYSHLLACSKSVDLSCNELSSIQPLKSLVACKELLLDDNQIADVTPLVFLKKLEKLSLSKNKIDSLDQLKPLQEILTLKELTLSSNNICNIENIDEQVKEFLPQVQRVIW